MGLNRERRWWKFDVEIVVWNPDHRASVKNHNLNNSMRTFTFSFIYGADAFIQSRIQNKHRAAALGARPHFTFPFSFFFHVDFRISADSELFKFRIRAWSWFTKGAFTYAAFEQQFLSSIDQHSRDDRGRHPADVSFAEKLTRHCELFNWAVYHREQRHAVCGLNKPIKYMAIQRIKNPPLCLFIIECFWLKDSTRLHNRSAVMDEFTCVQRKSMQNVRLLPKRGQNWS